MQQYTIACWRAQNKLERAHTRTQTRTRTCTHTHTLHTHTHTHTHAHAHAHTHACTHTHTHSQLQSLVAKTQWGQLGPVLTNLLEDRQQTAAKPTEEGWRHRSVYRETLFFKAAIMGSINVGEVTSQTRLKLI